MEREAILEGPLGANTVRSLCFQKFMRPSYIIYSFLSHASTSSNGMGADHHISEAKDTDVTLNKL